MSLAKIATIAKEEGREKLIPGLLPTEFFSHLGDRGDLGESYFFSHFSILYSIPARVSSGPRCVFSARASLSL